MSDDYLQNPLWRQCVKAAEAGDNKGAVFVLTRLAESGIWQLLSQVGAYYEAGGGNLEKNLVEANKWYRKAVFECDDPVTHLGLGRAYYNGDGGIQKDYDKAYFHFMKAFHAEMPEAGIYLGIMTFDGISTEKNVVQAREYFQFAANNDYCLAYFYLAKIEFHSGHWLLAVKYFLKARRLLAELKKNDQGDPRLLGCS